MRRFPLAPAAMALALLAALAVPASAWWPAGHSIITRAAVRCLPAEVPAFFRDGGDAIAHYVQDPDVSKNRGAPNLYNQEHPEHFIDFEMLKGKSLPPTRYEYIKMCIQMGVDPFDVGLAPYAITEWTERLAVAFAEHRRWPEDRLIQQKCLLYAGYLGHYAQDICQPLHTTVHYDGRTGPDGKSPRSGIHNRVDALIEKMEMKPEDLAKDQTVKPLQSLLPGVLQEIDQSRALVDRVYELEAKLPPTEGATRPGPEVTAFANERARESTRFTASLYLTAWQKSKSIQLPSWLERGK